MAEIDEQLYKELIDKIKTYHPSDDFSMVEKAYKLAVEAHKEQKRKSGEPYIIHPLKVAYILAELELDMETITAGILHDIIEDTPYTYEDDCGRTAASYSSFSRSCLYMVSASVLIFRCSFQLESINLFFVILFKLDNH